MKKFFTEFKTFITRGNVIDMAVGVIVGSSFTAIVNGMSNFILKPIINKLLSLIFDANSLSELYTFLTRVDKDVLDEAGNVIGKEADLAQSIYIDWGAFINAVINFFIVALVLFTIVKMINKLRADQKAFSERLADLTLDRNERKELKKAGVNVKDKQAIKEYFENKKKAAEKAAEEEKKAAEEKARLERLNNPTTEDLLKDILAELKKNK
jgi:large conductance mechanosensitive channel